MMKIIADSSANISALEGVCFQSIPMTIRAGEREFVDDGTLDTAKMLDYLASYNGKSGTACPGLDAWLQAFSGADEIFVVTITGALSGTCASAVAARDLYLQSHPEAKIHVFDSLSTGPEMLLLIEKLADLIREGKSFDEICKAGQDYLASTHLLFILRSIHNLAQNGRVSKLAAGAVGILGIQILAKASEQGTIEPVEGTPMDLRTLTPIGAHIDDDFVHLRQAGGYDHNYVLDRDTAPAAELWCPATGIGLAMTTSMEGMQLYTAGWLTERVGKDGAVYGPAQGVCLETQHFPNAVNCPAFPSPILRAGETLRQWTTFRFFAR